MAIVGGEEMAGPAAPKIVRLMYFVGAGIVCTAAINKWRDLERKSILQQGKAKDPSQLPTTINKIRD
uniref:Transmembrane protein n=1 Tax=Kalanchoe fedtschenkoi TaxID=63787 RepID=A0A7N0V9G7_KALFE